MQISRFPTNNYFIFVCFVCLTHYRMHGSRRLMDHLFVLELKSPNPYSLSETSYLDIQNCTKKVIQVWKLEPHEDFVIFMLRRMIPFQGWLCGGMSHVYSITCRRHMYTHTQRGVSSCSKMSQRWTVTCHRTNIEQQTLRGNITLKKL